jgi:hypothetical protein
MMPGVAITNLNRVLILLTVGICAALAIDLLVLLLRQPPALNSDFMAFWSFPRFAAGHPVTQIYDAATLQAFQKTLYPGFRSFYPYLYPPTFLLPSWWLKFLPFGQAEGLWTLAGLAMCVPAAMALFPRHRLAVLVAILASPASILNFMTGETAYFTAALLFFGLAALPTRPALAGIAFGLLTLKPQLGVLIPVLLLARGEFRCILFACLTAGALVALSCLAFPPDLWLLWWRTLPAYQSQYFSGGGLNLNIIVTPAANLVTLGLAPAVAWGAQIGIAVLVAALLVWVARRAPYRVAVAALLAGSFLAVPHAYAYDSITIPAAMALCLTARTPTWQVLLGCLVYLAPLLLLSPAHRWFLYAAPEALLFASIIALASARPDGAMLHHEPDSLSAIEF